MGSNWADFPHVFRGFRGQIGFIPSLGAQLSLEKSLRLPLKPQKPTLCRFEIDFCTIWLPFKGRMGRFLASKRYQYSRLTQRKVQKIPSPSGRGRRLQRQHLNKQQKSRPRASPCTHGTDASGACTGGRAGVFLCCLFIVSLLNQN